VHGRQLVTRLGMAASPRRPRPRNRRSHRGRYHTDRQPGDAAQYTARCRGRPARRLWVVAAQPASMASSTKVRVVPASRP
jgi:hypothetical protein